MNRLIVGERPLDFSLPDQYRIVHKLSDINRSQNVLLVFNIGFV